MQRWNLLTGEREATSPLPGEGTVDALALGLASSGPLLLSGSDAVTLFDLATLRPLAAPGAAKNTNTRSRHATDRGGHRASAAADGSLFAVWGEREMRSMRLLRADGSLVRAQLAPGGGIFTFPGDYALPSPDGRWIYTGKKGILTDEEQPVAADHLREMTLVPASHPAYFVALKRDKTNFITAFGSGGVAWEVAIYAAADRRALVSLGKLEELHDTGLGMCRSTRPMPSTRLMKCAL